MSWGTALGTFWYLALPIYAWRNLSISMLTQEGAWSQKRSCLIKYETPSAFHLSLRTEEAYLGWIRRCILFHHKRHPKDMGTEEVQTFLFHLAVHAQVAASTQNVALNALLFLYRYVLHQPWPKLEPIAHAKRPRQPLALRCLEMVPGGAGSTGAPWQCARPGACGPPPSADTRGSRRWAHAAGGKGRLNFLYSHFGNAA